MRPFTFHPGPRLAAGQRLHERLPGLLPDGPCLFVTDEGVRRLGLADPFCEALQDSGRLVTVFDRRADRKDHLWPGSDPAAGRPQSGRFAAAARWCGQVAAYLLGPARAG